MDGEAEVDGEGLACMTERFGALELGLDLALLVLLLYSLVSGCCLV